MQGGITTPPALPPPLAVCLMPPGGSSPTAVALERALVMGVPARASSGASRTRLIEALIAIEAKAQRAVEEAVDATISGRDGSPEELLLLDEQVRPSKTQNFKLVAERRQKLKACASTLRDETSKLEIELSCFKAKEVDFVQDLGRLLSDNEQKEAELLARVESLTDEQRELCEASAQQEQELRSLQRELEEMNAYKIACENRVQFLMDQLVILLSSGQDAENGQILRRILADGEEHCRAAQSRFNFFSQQLDGARQENRARAQRLSDMQVATTAIHEKMCTLQNQVLERKLFHGRYSSWSGAVARECAPVGSRVAAVGSGITPELSRGADSEGFQGIPHHAGAGLSSASNAKASATAVATRIPTPRTCEGPPNSPSPRMGFREGGASPSSSPPRGSPRHCWLRDPMDGSLRLVSGTGAPPPNSPFQQPGAREDGHVALVSVMAAGLASRQLLDKPPGGSVVAEKARDGHVVTLERQLREVLTPVRSETPPSRAECGQPRSGWHCEGPSHAKAAAAAAAACRGPGACRSRSADHPEILEAVVGATAASATVVTLSQQAAVARASSAGPPGPMPAVPGAARRQAAGHLGLPTPHSAHPTSGLWLSPHAVAPSVNGFLGQSRSSPLVAVSAAGRDVNSGDMTYSPAIRRRDSQSGMALSCHTSPARVDVRWTAPIPQCRIASRQASPLASPEAVVRSHSSESAASPGQRPLSPRASSSPPGSARGALTGAWQAQQNSARRWMAKVKPASPRLGSSSGSSSTPTTWQPWTSLPVLPAQPVARTSSRSGSPMPLSAPSRGQTTSTPLAHSGMTNRSLTPLPLVPARESRRIPSGGTACGWRSVSIPVCRPRVSRHW